jgi:hypothetical protein
MSESLDEQLARLDAEYQRKQAQSPNQSSSQSMSPSDDLDDLIQALDHTHASATSQPASASARKDELDEILAQVEFERNQQPKPSPSSDNSSLDQLLDEITAKPSSPPQPTDPQEDIDSFLSQVKSEQTQKRKQQPPQSSTNTDVDKVLTDITANFVTRPSSPSSAQPSQTNQHLKKIASQHRPQDVAQALQNLEQQQEQQRLSAKREQRQRETLKGKAQEWLKKLDPYSDEGMWFEEFAYAYDTKLDAAMDYLSALGEVS